METLAAQHHAKLPNTSINNGSLIRRNMMLFAYLDESGLNQTAKATVVGGLLGTLEQWVGFEKKWRAALPKGINSFHTRRCQIGTKEYRNMSEPDHVSLAVSHARLLRDAELHEGWPSSNAPPLREGRNRASEPLGNEFGRQEL
jgi:hypothetical protein